MDWIPALLKHLAISRSVVGAVFITSAVLYSGPRLLPAYVDPVPKDWAYALVGALVFSACLLLFWSCSAAWAMARHRWVKTVALLSSHELGQLEVDILHSLGENPSEPLNIQRVDYEGLGLSRLEVLELMHGLSKKGLVSINQFDSKLVSLTPIGRERALEIQRAAKHAA